MIQEAARVPTTYAFVFPSLRWLFCVIAAVVAVDEMSHQTAPVARIPQRGHITLASI